MQDRIGDRQASLPQNIIVLGPGDNLIKQWQQSWLEIPDTDVIRDIRYQRVLEQLKLRGLDAILVYDPTNLRYITDTSNMSVWLTHNANRYAILFADGSLVLYDYKDCEHISTHNPLITEQKQIIHGFILRLLIKLINM